MKGPKVFFLKVTDTPLMVSSVVSMVLPSVNFCLCSNHNYVGVYAEGIIPEIYFTAFRVKALWIWWKFSFWLGLRIQVVKTLEGNKLDAVSSCYFKFNMCSIIKGNN